MFPVHVRSGRNKKKTATERDKHDTHNDKDVAETNGGNKKGVDLQIGVADFQWPEQLHFFPCPTEFTFTKSSYLFGSTINKSHRNNTEIALLLNGFVIIFFVLSFVKYTM